MKNYIVIMLIAACFSCVAQKNQETSAVKDKSGNLVGIATKELLQQEPFSEWFGLNYDEYELDATVTEQLKPLLKKVNVKVFMGTWCGDSKEQVPVFYKIMDAVKVISSCSQTIRSRHARCHIAILCLDNRWSIVTP